MDLALPLSICVAALAMFEGARARRRWALWPALFLLVAIIPAKMIGLVDFTRLTGANYTTPHDLTAYPDNPFAAFLSASQVEYQVNRGKVILATLCMLAIVTMPVPILWHLRRKEVLQ